MIRQASAARRMMIEACKLAQLVQSTTTGLQLSEHLCTAIYAHAYDLSCEGIVSKRLGSRYVSGHTNNWIKVKNLAAPAIKREAEEDWSR